MPCPSASVVRTSLSKELDAEEWQTKCVLPVMFVMGMAVPGQSTHSWGYLTYRYVLQRDRPASVAREVDNTHAGLVKCAMLSFKPGYKITSDRVRHTAKSTLLQLERSQKSRDGR